MAPTTNKDNLPAYNQLEQSEAASEIFLDRIQATISAERTVPDEEPFETHRMRNFLLYCLAIDYPCPLNISAQRCQHFLGMRRLLKNLYAIRETVHLTAEDRRKLAPYLCKHLHAPCASLEIPVESAVVMIERYGKFVNVLGHYKGCVHSVLHTYGPARLAAKLSMDTNILVTCLAASVQMRRELNKRINETAKQYFTLIHGRSSAIFCAPGADSSLLPFDKESGIRYELTARGRLHQDNRKHAFHTIAHAVRPLVDRALACVESARRRPGAFLSTAADGVLCDQTCMGPGQSPQEPAKESPMWAEPPRWRDAGSVHLPELFEHRLGQGHCDS
ncbi:hypothetical protein MBLNU13_g06911t1 [Cladosporium sp. NU13]